MSHAQHSSSIKDHACFSLHTLEPFQNGRLCRPQLPKGLLSPGRARHALRRMRPVLGCMQT